MHDVVNRGSSDPARRKFGDFWVDCLSREGLLNRYLLDSSSLKRSPTVVFDVNGHGISLARTNPAYRNLVKRADIIHSDGGFLVPLSRWLDGPEIPERSSTTDMIHDFARRFEDTGHSFFLLGATEEVNALCADQLSRRYPRLTIAGRRNGYFSAADEDSIIGTINAAHPDVVWIGLGKPKEQEVALRWRDRLDCNWIITCGGCFNYITGHYSRAPQWMQDRHLEWLHRMVTNPRKLFWRYLTTTPHSLWIAVREHR